MFKNSRPWLFSFYTTKTGQLFKNQKQKNLKNNHSFCKREKKNKKKSHAFFLKSKKTKQHTISFRYRVKWISWRAGVCFTVETYLVKYIYMDEAYISSHRNQVSNIIQMTFATQNCWGVAYLHTKRTRAFGGMRLDRWLDTTYVKKKKNGNRKREREKMTL